MQGISEIIQQKKFESSQQKVLINLVYSAGWAKGRSSACLKPFNLSWQQFNLMRILKGQNGKAVSLKVLAERMLDPQSNASRLVDKLVEKGLIERHTCPNDRRQVRLHISKKGAIILDKASSEMSKVSQSLGGDLTEQEMHQLSDLLDRFRNQNVNN